ncbi:MAG: TIGR04255 family protein [Hydrogenophaga sp.]|nr:TIGR04255 family protein [Hydrogenophaga sp.]
MNTANRFEPLHDAHAIELVQFSFQFLKPLSDGAMSRLIESMNQFEQELPVRQDLRNVSVSIGMNGPSSIGQIQGSIDGALRQSIARNGAVEKELRVERTGIGFRDSSYTRWDNVWRGCQSFIQPLLLAIAGDEAIINVVQLQYVDKFIWHGEKNKCRAAEALRVGSKYLVPAIFESEDFWHSHTGHFVRINERVKRLVQINVDHLEENTAKGACPVIRAATVVIDLLNQPGYQSDLVGFREHLEEKMQEMHNLLKAIFSELVSESMARRVGMSQ